MTDASSEKLTSKCSICNQIGDGLHFGAEACRACTAFFRRSVVLQKQYECRTSGGCTVNTIVRSICKACRWQKCLEMGMRVSSVQQKRDSFGKKREEGCSRVPEPPLPSPVNVLASSEFMPTLWRMKTSYEKLENARSVIYRRDGENVFEPRMSKPLNFRESLEIASTEIDLIADWISWCFEEFSALPVDQKAIMFQNFFPYFYVLERAFKTVKEGGSNFDKMIMASGDYVNTLDLQTFFKDDESGDNGEFLAKAFQPFVDLQKRSLNMQIFHESLDFYEFLGLTVLLLWDYGLDEQTEECGQLGRLMKLRVSREINSYLVHVKKAEEPLSRVAMIIAILPSLHRVVNRLRENISMAHIFEAYQIPSNVVNIMNGKC